MGRGSTADLASASLSGCRACHLPQAQETWGVLRGWGDSTSLAPQTLLDLMTTNNQNRYRTAVADSVLKGYAVACKESLQIQ